MELPEQAVQHTGGSDFILLSIKKGVLFQKYTGFPGVDTVKRELMKALENKDRVCLARIKWKRICKVL